jgi:polyferredoxin
MASSPLRKGRIALSLICFSVYSVILLDLSGTIPASVTRGVLYLQFVPSAIHFFKLISLAVAGFIFIILLTFIFGRVYCSSVCPLGVLQDITARISRKLTHRKRYHFSAPYRKLNYAVLILVLIIAFAGFLLPLNITDPYSNFGRITTGLARPAIILLNNGIASLLEKINLYTLPRIAFKNFSLEATLYSAVILFSLTLATMWHGRLFCNTLCPVGSLLGRISQFSLFNLQIDGPHCNHCGRCATSCKAECIDFTAHTIDASRCISCFNCIGSCPSNGISYNWCKKDIPLPYAQMETDQTRRSLFGSMAALLSLSSLAFIPREIETGKPSTIPDKKKNPVCPPGSKGYEHYNKTCTACHLCVSLCPTQVLKPSVLEYGLSGFLQPLLDYHASFCNFECRLCGEVCPTGAILPLLAEEKKLLQLGKSIFVKENCIVNTRKTACGACSEHCPSKAVQMVPYEGKLKIPEVTQDICIGCGACEYACPTKPYKAIYVDGHRLHRKAKKPVEKKPEQMKVTEDFPF